VSRCMQALYRFATRRQAGAGGEPDEDQHHRKNWACPRSSDLASREAAPIADEGQVFPQRWRGRNIAALMTPMATKATAHMGQTGARSSRLVGGELQNCGPSRYSAVNLTKH
jgi:hypothetical protein